VNTILQTVGSLIVAAIGAGVGWAATEFGARPVRRFYDLRAEIIQKMAQYGNVRAPFKQTQTGDVDETMPPLNPEEPALLREGQAVMRDLAARMRAFTYNEILARFLLTLVLRFDPHKASLGLFGYSNTMNTYGSDKASKLKMIEEALHLPAHTL
jgi:hypothetical protein